MKAHACIKIAAVHLHHTHKGTLCMSYGSLYLSSSSERQFLFVNKRRLSELNTSQQSVRWQHRTTFFLLVLICKLL